MAKDDSTEKATPKKRKDTREKGEVRKSHELNSAIVLLTIFAVIKAFSKYFGQKASSLFVTLYQSLSLAPEDFSISYLRSYMLKAILTILIVIAPIIITAVVVGMGINYLQVGFLFTSKALAPKFSRLNPIKGLKKNFSVKAVVQLLKSMIKMIIIVFVTYNIINQKAKQIPHLMVYNIEDSFLFMIDTTLTIALTVGMYLLIFGIADFFYEWLVFEKELKMTKQEVKDEYKQTEGDPIIKGKIKRKQREISMRRMMQAVPLADVIITNPTHFAIALKYDSKLNASPIVIAKGKDFVAQKIKEKAREHKIEIVENKPLAQALYASTEIGQQIPESMYKAVAEILAQIYKIKRLRGEYR